MRSYFHMLCHLDLNGKWITKYKMPFCCDSSLFQADRHRKEIQSFLSLSRRMKSGDLLLSFSSTWTGIREDAWKTSTRKRFVFSAFWQCSWMQKGHHLWALFLGTCQLQDMIFLTLGCYNSICSLLPTYTNDYIWTLEYITVPPHPQIRLPNCRVPRLPSIYLSISDWVYANVKAFLKAF